VLLVFPAAFLKSAPFRKSGVVLNGRGPKFWTPYEPGTWDGVMSTFGMFEGVGLPAPASDWANPAASKLADDEAGGAACATGAPEPAAHPGVYPGWAEMSAPTGGKLCEDELPPLDEEPI